MLIIYNESVTQLGDLLDTKKVVERKNNGALTAYYIVEVRYPSEMSYEIISIKMIKSLNSSVRV